jgi:hypothetical protein
MAARKVRMVLTRPSNDTPIAIIVTAANVNDGKRLDARAAGDREDTDRPWGWIPSLCPGAGHARRRMTGSA